MNEIIEMARIFADAKLAPTIHIHNVHDNKIDKYFAAAEPDGKGETEEETQEDGELPPELLMVLKGDRELCRDIVRQAPFIVYAGDFRVQLRPVFDRHGFNLRTLNRREFFAAYIPLLTNYKNKKSVETLCHTTFL